MVKRSDNCTICKDIKQARFDAQQVIPDRVKDRGIAKANPEAFYKKSCQLFEPFLIPSRTGLT